MSQERIDMLMAEIERLTEIQAVVDSSRRLFIACLETERDTNGSSIIAIDSVLALLSNCDTIAFQEKQL